MLGAASYLIKLQLHLLLWLTSRLEHFEHVSVSRLFLKLSNTQLPISIWTTRGYFKRVCQHQGVILATRDVEKVLVSLKWANLACIHAFDRVVGVAKLSFRSQAPGSRKVLRAILLLDLLLLGDTMQIFLRHLIVLILLHPISTNYIFL